MSPHLTRCGAIATAHAELLLVGVLLVGCETRKANDAPRPERGVNATGPRDASVDAPVQGKLYDGFGNYTRKVTTASPEAQRFFDQGMQLLYGFNHDEAIRSFARAAAIDPECAMAWWGIAYANGLHINNPAMSEAKSRAAHAAAQEATKRLAKASPVEQSLIRAVEQRYAAEPPQDRRPLDEAYAAAMGGAWQAHPDDPDVAALYAESLMNLQPWDYWTHQGQPKGRIEEIVATLERAMALRPDHPGANHFYIHAVEASGDPGRATAAADRLTNLVPGSGHLVHMPSHIFIRTGRYADAVESNAKAAAVDEAYFANAPTPDFYALYYLHNVHFLAYASMMEGNHARAMEAARRLERQAPPAFVRDYVKMADGILPAVMHVMVRFGRWEEILSEPEPPAFRLVSRAMWRYARAVALGNTGRLAEAEAELSAFDALATEIGTGTWFVGNNPAEVVLGMARGMAVGEIAFKKGDHEQAFALLREAVKTEDELVYDEPPGWMQPVRHALGALLLSADRAAEAETVFREDLAKHPNNGWSLIGLEQSLAALGRDEERTQVAVARETAWARADVTPPSSCYCHKAP